MRATERPHVILIVIAACSACCDVIWVAGDAVADQAPLAFHKVEMSAILDLVLFAEHLEVLLGMDRRYFCVAMPSAPSQSRATSVRILGKRMASFFSSFSLKEHYPTSAP